MLSKPDLFERLALERDQGHAARIAVVTPNTRLARSLQGEFDAFQAARNRMVWEAPDILPFSAFVARQYEDARYGLARELPLLLSGAQEEWLWQEILRQSSRELLVLDRAAAQCRDAWRLVHVWRIGAGQGNEDAAAFSAWSEQYRRKTARDVDAARLPDLAASLLKELKKPAQLVAYAFDILPPQTKEYLDACRAEGIEVLECRPQPGPASTVRTTFASAREELEAAAQWARVRLEAGGARIGVVIPELEQRRREVVRVFSRVMQPGFNLPGAVRAPLPFNVSLGMPLLDYPLVAAALTLFELSVGEISFARASALIRSPFLGGAEGERAARAKLDAKIRRGAPSALSLGKLLGLSEGCPGLRRLLDKMFDLRAKENLGAHDWARQVFALLEAAGFPGERALDSDEYQARAKWHEVLGEFARLERVAGVFSARGALSVLRKLCRETLFQPESGDAPVQVLGILESAGTEFDHLWVSGLTDEAWPLQARPNPFIPVALQKKAGIPEASAESSLALDRGITGHWLGAAPEVVVSSPAKDEDRDLSPSPLILHVPPGEVRLPGTERYRDLVFAQRFAQRAISAAGDTRAAAVREKSVRGGTRVLADQAACPFRAFARWRLDAERLEAPSEGLEAAKRGTLIHVLMKNLWAGLKDSSALREDPAPAIARAAQAAVQELGLEGRFAELERDRLGRLAAQWLEVEKARPPFEIHSLEEKRTLQVAGLEFSSRIDRMDRLASGGHALVDYKTGATVTSTHWKVPRPHDPQLPLYAVSAKEDIAAVVFAKVRPGDMKFVGSSRDEKAFPSIRKSPDWAKQLGEWRTEAEALGAAFAGGEARVDPKNALATCRYCALHALCRVYEKINVLAEPEEE